MKSSLELKKLVQRKDEQEQLVKFLDDTGGALLIGGDRGAGKTTLVSRVISEQKRIHRPSGIRKYFYNNQIVLNIPLIIETKGEKDRISEAVYRSLLLRAIARGMESDLINREYDWLDLPKRWFRNIGYVQAVKRLAPFVNSTKYERSNQLEAGLMKVLNLSRLSASSQSIDISDAVIEMKLRDIFQTYSKFNQIIIVIDELDKLEIYGSEGTVEKLVVLLKNLFSETGVHAIFIAHERAVNRINAQITKNPFSIEHTLYKNVILLNRLRPTQLEAIIHDLLRDKGRNEHRKILASVAMITSLMPSELDRLRQMYKFNSKSIIDDLKTELGHSGYEHKSVAYVIVNELYSTYADREKSGFKSGYYNRILWRSLSLAADIIVSEEVNVIDWDNPINIYYISSYFDSDDDEYNSKKDEEFNVETKPSIMTEIASLNLDNYYDLDSALNLMLTIMNRSGLVNLSVIDEDHPHLLKIEHDWIIEAEITQLEPDINATTNPTKEELKRVEYLNEHKDIYRAVTDKDILSGMEILPVSYDEDSDWYSTFGDDERTYSNIRPYWDRLDAILANVDDTILNTIRAKIETSLNSKAKFRPSPVVVTVDDKNKRMLIEWKNVKVDVFVDFGSFHYYEHEDTVKSFILYELYTTLPRNRNKKIKQLKCNSRWNSISDRIEQIATEFENVASK